MFKFRWIAILIVVSFIGMSLTGISNAQEENPNSLAVSETDMDEAWASDFGDSLKQQYIFTAVEDNFTTVVIVNENGASGIVANLMEVGSQENISSMNTTAGATTFCVPAGKQQYLLSLERDPDSEATSYEAIITNQPTSVCDLDIISRIELEINGTEFLTENAIDSVIDVNGVVIPVTINTGIQVNSANDDDTVSLIVDTGDNFPSVSFVSSDNIVLVDVNVSSDEDALLDVDVLGDDVIAVYVYETEDGTLTVDVVPGDASGVTIADDLAIELGLEVDVELTEDGLMVDVSLNDDSIVNAQVIENDVVVSLLEEEVVTVDTENVLTDDLAIGNIDLPVELALNADDLLTDGLTLDVDAISEEGSLSLTGTLDNGDDNLLFVDVNVMSDEDALLDVDVLSNDVIAVYVYETEDGTLTVDVVPGDASGVTIADDLSTELGLEVDVELIEDGLLVDVSLNDDSIVNAQVIENDVVVSLLEEEVVTVDTENVLTDDLAIGNIDLPVELALNADDLLTDGLILDVDAVSEEGSLSLMGTLDNGDDNLLFVDVNVMSDEDALLDVDVLSNDVIAVYVYEAEDGTLTVDVVPGDASGVTIADDLSTELGLEVDVELTEDGLMVDVSLNDDSIVNAQVIDNDVVVSLLEEEVVTVDTENVLTDDLAIGNIDLPVELALNADDLLTDGLILDVDAVSEEGSLSLMGTLDNGDDNLLFVDVNVLSDEDALLDVDALSNDVIAVYVYETEDGTLTVDVVPGDASGVTIADDLSTELGLEVDVELTEDGLMVDVSLNDDSIVNAQVIDNGLAVSLLEEEFAVVDAGLLENAGILNSDSSCTATPNTSFATINVRSLPTTASNPVDVVSVDSDLNVTGQALEGTWLQVTLPDGQTGYVSAGILSLAEVCATVELPVIAVDLAEIQALEASVAVEADVAGVEADANVTVDGDGVNVNVETDAAGVDANADVTVGGDGVNVETEAPGVDVDVTVDGDGVDLDVDVDDVGVGLP